jgi:hypothetical protein
LSLPPPPPPGPLGPTGPAGLPSHPPTQATPPTQPLPPVAPSQPSPASSRPASAPAATSRRRRWPWVTAVVVLTLALLAAVIGFVDARREADAAKDDAAALDTRLADLQAQIEALQQAAREGTSDNGSSSGSGDTGNGKGNGDNGNGDTGDDDSGDAAAPTDPLSALQDLLKGILGGDVDPSKIDDMLKGLLGGGAMSDALDGVDPKCLFGDDPAGALGGLTKGGGITGTVEEQVATIADLVQAERGLTFKTDVKPEFLPAAEFDARIADMVKAQYPAGEADLDGRQLGLLGAVPEGTDMKAVQTDLLSGQVAGYYDPDSGDVVVRVPEGSGSLDVNGQITLAHELDHMLTDQRLGLPRTDEAGESDANLAALALTEGDATLLMQRFTLQNVGLMDQLGSAISPDAAASEQDLANVPSYLRNELLFPYTSGMAYTCRLSANGGWPAVDKAYSDLPATSAEILFDGRDNAAPAATAPLGALGGSWDEARRDTFGAAPLLWLFKAPGGDEGKALPDAEALAQHWAGGDLVLYTDGPKSALGLSLVDTADGGALCDAVRSWYGAAFGAGSTGGDVTTFDGAGRAAALRCHGRDVVLGIAPDAPTASALAG